MPSRAARSPFAIDAPHFAGGRFFWPWGMPRRSPRDVLRWQLRRRATRERRPRAPIPRRDNDGSSLGGVAETPELTWIGHASFALHCGEQVALLDPHFGPRALLPRRWTPPGFPIESIPPDAFALLSHNHYDHLDRWTLTRMPKSIDWLVPLGLGGFVRAAGFESVRELDWGDEVRLGPWYVTLLPAQHWSRRLSQPENSTLWGSWLVDTGTFRLLYVGDSGDFAGFDLLGRRLAPIDVVILPIGAYLPQWFMQPAHLSPREALGVFRRLSAGRMVASHWGTFDLADDAVDEPPVELRRCLNETEHDELAARVELLEVGETLRLPG